MNSKCYKMLRKHLYRLVSLTIIITSFAGVFETSEAQTSFDQLFPVLAAVKDHILQNGRITPQELIERHGYPYEEHEVVTEDGYILTVHRIPYGQYGTYANRIPIYVQHGVFSSSADWVVTGPTSGAGFILADAGFDVWLGNARGNTYSRKHKTLDPDNPTDKPIYWNFTFHQMGYYDLPAVIDHILQTTSYSQIVYLGHSMGTTMFYIMSSIRPEYNAQVKAFFSCSTCVYLQHMTSPIRLVLTTSYEIRDTFELLGIYEILSQKDTVPGLNDWCTLYSPLASFCGVILQAFSGITFGNYNETAWEEILQNYPAGTSTYVVNHLAQNTMIGMPFTLYIRSILGNILFGFPKPYPLWKVTVPVYIHICNNDSLTTPTDVLRVVSELPNIAEVVTTEGCNHADYLWGKNTKQMYLNHIISLIYSLK